MSLINQMLRDLEQRRTAEAGVSPLGGLSATGPVTQSVNFSINYATLAIALTVLFVGGVLLAYLMGSQQQVTMVEDKVSAAEELPAIVAAVKQPVSAIVLEQENAPKKEVPAQPLVVAELMPKLVTVEAQSMVTTEPASASKQTLKPVEESAASVEITPIDEVNAEEAPAHEEENINKSIRPLTEEQQAQLAFQRGIKLLGRGNQQGAQIALEESLAFSPTNTRARETLAALLLNEGRVSEAAGILRDGLQLTSGAASLAKLYARILVDQGDVALAVRVLEGAAPAVSADPEYYALLAALYRQEKKHAQAVQLYQQILMQRPGVASWWMGLALSQDAMGEGAKALDAFQRAQRAGGLGAEVLKYVQSRIVSLTPVTPKTMTSSSDTDEFGE